MTITNPVGIDAEIQKLQSSLLTKLFVGKIYSSNGRAFLNMEDKGFIPEVYEGSEEYQEVLLDDTKDAISFFTVDPEMKIALQEVTARVSIYFFVNLATLFSYTHRATEEVHTLVLKQLNNSSFRAYRLIQGIEAIKDFEIRRPELMNMQPFYVFRFDTLITYKLC